MEKKINMKLNEVGTITATVDKNTYARVKSADEIIVEEVREIMKESGISDFYDIDENKILQLVKEHKAIEIIRNKPQHELAQIQWRKVNTYEEYENMAYRWDSDYWDMIYTKEEYDLLKEVLL